MPDFIILRGKEINLPKGLIDGYVYICIDTGSVYIDYIDNEQLKRKKFNIWDNIQDKPLSFKPETHASTHSENGSDPITPESINAISVNLKGQSNGIATLDNNGLIPISQLPSQVKQLTIVDNIAERDSIPNLFAGLQVYVKDASADETVASGGAQYLYDGSTWIKTGEAESMDLVVGWDNINNKPENFIPAPHNQEISTIIGLSSKLSEIENSINNIETTIGFISSTLDDINGKII